MKHLALLAILVILFSCQHKDNDYAGLIKGDWVGPTHDTTYPKRYLSFEDSTFRYSAFERMPLKYEVRKNDLYLGGLPPENEGKLLKYSIIKLTTDSLVLLRNRTALHDTLRYYKPHPKNNITPTVIYFGSGGLGIGPVMDLKIDSARNVYFYGERNTSMPGGYFGRISQKEYNAIIGYIRNVPVDSLREYYEADWTDDMTESVSIVYNNSVIFCAAYGNYKEPVELRLLFTKLMNLYKHLALQPDSSVNEDYFSKRPMESSKPRKISKLDN